MTGQPLDQRGYKGAKKDIQGVVQSCGIAFSVAVTVIITVAMVGCTVAFAYILSSKDNYTSSQMLVLTGRRTRDWTTTHSYSMNVFGNDPHTRLYVCMKSAGVSVSDTTIESIGAYRSEAKKKDCTLESDGGWPRDIGFLRCIQKKFGMTFRQSNLFLSCLDHTEGTMVESIQTDTSSLFLGSYNFVALLIVAMGVMTAFFIFTASGWFVSEALWGSIEQIEQDPAGNVVLNGERLPTMIKAPVVYSYVASHWEWVPLAALPNFLALLWSMVLFGASMWFTYPQRGMWGDTVSIDGGQSSFPGTPWTGNICSGVTLLMFMYFASCLWEWWSDRSDRMNFLNIRKAGHKDFFDAVKAGADEKKNKVLKNGPTIPLPNGVFNQPGSIPNNVPNVTRMISPNRAEPVSGVPLITNPIQRRQSWQFSTDIDSKYPNSSRLPNLGVRYKNELYYSTDREKTDLYLRMTPLLNKVFSFSWVFVDGLLFVGMINSQNSPLNENVVDIWFYIIACRGFQFAASYLMDDVMFVKPINPQEGAIVLYNPNQIVDEERQAEYDQIDKPAHAAVSASCCHIASLWCMILVLFHFINATSVTFSISSGSSISAVQISFIAIMMFMDLFKHVVGFSAILGYMGQETYCLMLQIIYTLDNLFRVVLIICALFPVTDYLGNISRNLDSYVVVATA